MIRTHVDSVLRMVLTVPLHMAIMIFVHLSMTLKRYRHWKILILILIHHLMDQTYLIKNGIWWTKIQNGRIQIMYSVIIKQNLANVHQDFAVRVMLVHNTTTVKIKGVVLGSTSTGQQNVFDSEKTFKISLFLTWNIIYFRSTPCPNVKHGEEWGEPGNCEQGDACTYCHTRTEQQFHPEIYKSTKCNDVQQAGYCPRGVFCAFAHVDRECTLINRT